MQTPVGDWATQEEFQKDHQANPINCDRKTGLSVKGQPDGREADYIWI